MAVSTPYPVPPVTLQQAKASDLTALTLGVEGHHEEANRARLEAARAVRAEYLQWSDQVYDRARGTSVDPDPRPPLALDAIIAAEGDVLQVIDREDFIDLVAEHLDLVDGERIVNDEDGARWEWVPATEAEKEMARSDAAFLRAAVHSLEHARALSLERNQARRSTTLVAALHDLPTALTGGVLGNYREARNARAEGLIALLREERFFLRNLRQALPAEQWDDIPRLPAPFLSVLEADGDLQRAFDDERFRFKDRLESYLGDANSERRNGPGAETLLPALREQTLGADEPLQNQSARSTLSPWEEHVVRTRPESENRSFAEAIEAHDDEGAAYVPSTGLGEERLTSLVHASVRDLLANVSDWDYDYLAEVARSAVLEEAVSAVNTAVQESYPDRGVTVSTGPGRGGYFVYSGQGAEDLYTAGIPAADLVEEALMRVDGARIAQQAILEQLGVPALLERMNAEAAQADAAEMAFDAAVDAGIHPNMHQWEAPTQPRADTDGPTGTRISELKPGQVINIVGVPATLEGLNSTPGIYRSMEFVHAAPEPDNQGTMLLLASQGRYAWLRTTADSAQPTGDLGEAHQSVGRVAPPIVYQQPIEALGKGQAHFNGYDIDGRAHNELVQRTGKGIDENGDTIVSVKGASETTFFISDKDNTEPPLTMISDGKVYPAPVKVTELEANTPQPAPHLKGTTQRHSPS
ncbi:hypothetical protein [Arthrobacter woluwensis]|uniref:Uncharacterized protein n=1 Tax=Arthrobacter woluwensis TaxID=156980 RepID=A0A1H4I7R7_9MICC|nr:hypothetical protein [Arthrobacter woluwensis]SEB30021.1 hypothetical protein SAMN04489745_0102 [Arthrobacter woluwensis]